MKDADTIFEHTQDALFLVNVANDETFTIQTINRAYEELTSLSRETLRNKTPRELLGDDQGAAVEARYQECVQKQAPIEYDEQLTIGGEMKYWHTRLTPVIEEDIVVQLVGATRDITDRHQHNQQLERERDRFQAVFDDAFDAMVIADDDGQYLEVNESATELFGLSKDELVGQSVKDFAPEEFDFEEAWQEFQDSERGRDTFPLVRPDGTERLVEYAASTNIVPGQHLSILRDVTEREKRQEELLEERAFIKQTLNTLTDVFYVVDPDGGVRRWNDRFREVTGYSDEQIAEMDAVEFFPESDRGRITNAIDEVLTAEEVTVEAEFLTADRERIPYEFTGARLTDAEGEVTGLVGVGRDVSKRKRRAEILQTLHNTTQAFIEASDRQAVADHAVETVRSVLDQPLNTIWLADESGDILRPVAATDEARSLFDELPTYTGDESLSWHAFETGEVSVYDDLRNTPERYNTETPIKSEIVLPLGEYGVMNFGATEPRAFNEFDVSLARLLGNIVESALIRANREENLQSQRKQLERQNERLEEFTSVVSHDLRNPLQVADGRLELVRDECESEHIDDVAQALDRMDTLIEDLLTLARQGDQVGEVERVVLAGLIEDCWQNVAAPEAEIVTDCNRTVNADRSRLQQLLENLLRNAVEHGGADVTVTIGELEEGFYVEDDGPGIPEKNRDDVFEAGYSTSSEGTGFGLRIVKQVAGAHGWKIGVAESEQGGARFEITGVEFADR